MAAITVDRVVRMHSVGNLTPASWLYSATGPDGKQFQNQSIGEMRRILRRNYGRDVEIKQNWEGPARAVRWSDINEATR